MANDSSLGAAGGGAFDLETQNGVMQLLASVRASELSSEDKSDLRDLVFLYTNGGRDESVKHSLLQKLASAGVEPVVVKAPEAPKPEKPAGPVIGSSRPSPSFAARVQSAPVQSTTPSPTLTPASAPTQTSTPEPEPVVVPDAPPLPEEPAPEPVPESLPVEPMPEVSAPFEPVSVPVAPAPEPVAHSIPPPPPPPVPMPEIQSVVEQPTSVPGADAESQLQRIREIKALVNERVGNPVNLVDINNELGREYMSALLDAMKRLNNGTPAASAMQRLEAAFAAVEVALDEHEQSGGQTTPVPEPVIQMPVSEPAPEQTAPEPASFAPVSMSEANPAPAPIFEPEIQQTESAEEYAPEPVPIQVVDVSREELESVVDSEGSLGSEIDNRPPMPTPPVMSSVPPAPAQESTQPEFMVSDSTAPRAVPAGAPAPKPSAMPVADIGLDAPAWGPHTDTVKPVLDNGVRKKTASLAESGERLRTPSELPDPASLETSSVDGDPLFTKEVDNGLDQLLSEWSLFKKSGLFGTGPKGREHPLFLKIKDLQIPLLLAGRFEGATQEIKQSITDYMNGWRYEQGIVYQQGETFERYLRRVIRHILDLQKN